MSEAAARAPSSLLGLARRCLGRYAAGAAALAAYQLTLNRIDWLSKAVLDDLYGPSPGAVRGAIAAMVALAIGGFVAHVAGRGLLQSAGQEAEYELRARLLRRLHRLGATFYRRMSAGEIVSRASSDLLQVRLLLGFGVSSLVNAAFALAASLQVMFGVSWRLAVATLASVSLLVPLTRFMSKRLYERTRDNQAALGRLAENLRNALAGVRVIRSLSLEARARERFAAANEAQLGTSLALTRARSVLTATIGAIVSLGILACFGYGGVLLVAGGGHGGITRGEFFAFWLAYEQLCYPLIVLGMAISYVQRGRAGHARLREILDAEPEVSDGPGPAPRACAGGLDVKRLDFHDGGRTILQNVSFAVPAGSSIAIVGRTGSGKSTLAMLLARMLPTPTGAVFLDGRDVCDLPLASLRGAVAYAQQEPFLFSTTVARNIAMGVADRDPAELAAIVHTAARDAQVDGEILRLPEGFDTVVGERGVQLSGGQRQRVALARALASDAPVLVLDDPLSAVDARTEAAILDALARRAADRTLVLVTHRISAAARCALVLVLDEGRVVEQGAPAELADAGGLYAAFADEQSAATELTSFAAVSGAAPSSGDVRPAPETAADARREEASLREFHEEAAPAGGSDARLALRVARLARAHSGPFALALAALVVVAAATWIRPILMGDVVERAVAGDPGGLLRVGALLATVGLALYGFRFVQSYAMQVGGARLTADLRARVFDHLAALGLRTYDRTPVGRLVTRGTADVDAVGEMFGSGVLGAVGDLVQLAGIVVLMLALDWRLSLFAFVWLPAVAVLAARLRGRWREASRVIRAKGARLAAMLDEQISGVAVVQAYRQEEPMARELDEVSVAHREANRRVIVYDAILDAAVFALSSLCTASLLAWAAIQHDGPQPIAFALLVTFTEYVVQFFGPVSLVAGRLLELQAGFAGAERVLGLLDDTNALERAAPSAADLAPEGPPDEAIGLEGVTFGYAPDAPVLHGVDLRVARGEHVALVGATGAGKSTIASLVLRLYEAQHGSVRVLGRDVRAYDRADLRELFAVVPQEVLLFAGTIGSNVAASDARPDRARIEAALGRVGALDLVRTRPGGVDARVDERGANFSAGERQLLALARASYRDAPIVLLDEATANVDSNTEARIQEASRAAMAGKTALVIAHRLSTIRAMDRIVVFHRGHVAEVGTHDALLAAGGAYARLHRLQFARERAEAVRK